MANNWILCTVSKIDMNYINIASRYAVSEERKVSSEQADRMKVDLESMDIRLEEERKRSAELMLQVTHLFSHVTFSH